MPTGRPCRPILLASSVRSTFPKHLAFTSTNELQPEYPVSAERVKLRSNSTAAANTNLADSNEPPAPGRDEHGTEASASSTLSGRPKKAVRRSQKVDHSQNPALV